MSAVQSHNDLFSDAQLHRRVVGFLISRVLWDPKSYEISVVAAVVYLSGRLDRPATLDRLERTCRRVAGVIAVDSSALRVDAPFTDRRVPRRSAAARYFLSLPAGRPGEGRTISSRAFTYSTVIAKDGRPGVVGGSLNLCGNRDFRAMRSWQTLAGFKPTWR
jgi:hypothetical protein